MKVRSEEFAWSAALDKTLTFEFLDNPGKDLSKYDVKNLKVVAEFTITPAASTTAMGEDFWRIINTVKLNDAGGQRIACKGTSLRAIAQKELGSAFADPGDSAEATAEVGALHFPLFFSLPNADGLKDARDSACPAQALRRGGSIALKLSGALLATDVTLTSATMYVTAELVRKRGRRPECPTRVCYRDESFTAAEQRFPVNGSVRSILFIADKGEGNATGLESWATSYEELDSATLGYSNKDRHELVEDYKELGPRSAIDMFDERKGGGVPYGIAFYVAPAEAQIVDLPNVATLHVKMGTAAPTNGVAIFSYIPDVPPEFIAAALGVGSGVAIELRDKRGIVATRDGRKVALRPLGAMRKRLPFKVDLGK